MISKIKGLATGTSCKNQLKHKFYVHKAVHSCEILWNIVKYNCNERKICVNAVQSGIMLKLLIGPQRTRNALIRGIWGNALWWLRLFIKYNSYGQFIALLLNVHHGYIKHCCLWISLTRGPLCVLLTTILQLFDSIFALAAMHMMYVDWDPLRLSRLAFGRLYITPNGSASMQEFMMQLQQLQKFCYYSHKGHWG